MAPFLSYPSPNTLYPLRKTASDCSGFQNSVKRNLAWRHCWCWVGPKTGAQKWMLPELLSHWPGTHVGTVCCSGLVWIWADVTLVQICAGCRPKFDGLKYLITATLSCVCCVQSYDLCTGLRAPIYFFWIKEPENIRGLSHSTHSFSSEGFSACEVPWVSMHGLEEIAQD